MYPGNLLGIAGFLKQYAKYSDLAQFLKMFAPEQNPKLNNFTYILINGGLDSQNDTIDNDVEANREAESYSPEYHQLLTLDSGCPICLVTLLPHT